MRSGQAAVSYQPPGSTSLTAEHRIQNRLCYNRVLTSSRVSSARCMTRKSSRASCPESPAGFSAGKRCRAVTACNTYPSAQTSERAAVIFLSASFSFSVVIPTASVFQPLAFLRQLLSPLSFSCERGQWTLRAPALARPRGAAGWERRVCERRVCGWELW